jgi:hypothetical protein
MVAAMEQSGGRFEPLTALQTALLNLNWVSPASTPVFKGRV